MPRRKSVANGLVVTAIPFFLHPVWCSSLSLKVLPCFFPTITNNLAVTQIELVHNAFIKELLESDFISALALRFPSKVAVFVKV